MRSARKTEGGSESGAVVAPEEAGELEQGLLDDAVAEGQSEIRQKRAGQGDVGPESSIFKAGAKRQACGGQRQHSL